MSYGPEPEPDPRAGHVIGYRPQRPWVAFAVDKATGAVTLLLDDEAYGPKRR